MTSTGRGLIAVCLALTVNDGCAAGGCTDGSGPDGECGSAVVVDTPPPTESAIDVNVVDHSPVPLRAELEAGGAQASWVLDVWPDCTRSDTADAAGACADTTDGHELCFSSCPYLTAWQYDPPVGGTTCMHHVRVGVPDDGAHPGPLDTTLHVQLFTWDGTAVSDRKASVELDEIPDHRAGYFHHATDEWNVTDDVGNAIPSNVLPRCSDSM